MPKGILFPSAGPAQELLEKGSITITLPPKKGKSGRRKRPKNQVVISINEFQGERLLEVEVDIDDMDYHEAVTYPVNDTTEDE